MDEFAVLAVQVGLCIVLPNELVVELRHIVEAFLRVVQIFLRIFVVP